MKCPKCEHKVAYQPMYSGSMYRCLNCDWLGTRWQTKTEVRIMKNIDWGMWLVLGTGCIIVGIIVTIILKDLGVI